MRPTRQGVSRSSKDWFPPLGFPRADENLPVESSGSWVWSLSPRATLSSFTKGFGFLLPVTQLERHPRRFPEECNFKPLLLQDVINMTEITHVFPKEEELSSKMGGTSFTHGVLPRRKNPVCKGGPNFSRVRILGNWYQFALLLLLLIKVR